MAYEVLVGPLFGLAVIGLVLIWILWINHQIPAAILTTLSVLGFVAALSRTQRCTKGDAG